MGKQKAAPPMRFEPSDFSTDKYRCVNVINLRDRCPVIIMASESCDPPYYRVVDGSLEMFYLSYSEAVDYCRQSGYMTQKKFFRRFIMINSTAYYNDFWNEMRGKQAVTDSLYNNRESKTNAYHLPGESNKKYTAVLRKESAVRQLATVVNATRSDSRLWTFDCEGQAEWGDMVNLEGMDNEDDFQRFEVQAYRLSELVRLGLEFASDQSFAIEDYVIGKMARCFGTSEEQAFINGTGENQPTGILHATDGAETGVTAESDSAISYDEIIKLYLSVDKKYRKHGTWLMNDETALALRTLKDSAGNYLWKESDETIFSKPVQIVDAMPSIGKGQKVIAFGDFSNYWLVQRFPLTIRTLKEKFAMRGQVGYLGCEYLDGKLIRKDAVKILQMAAD